MKRRIFLKNLGFSLPAATITSQIFASDSEKNSWPEYQYGHIKEFKDALTSEGQIILRFEFKNKENVRSANHEGKIKITGANVIRTKSYNFETNEDNLEPDELSFQTLVSDESKDIIVFWLENASPETTVLIENNKQTFEFTLMKLVKKKDVTFESEGTIISGNFLLDKEIGKISPEKAGIKPSGDNYSFAVMADPQGGDTDDPEKLRTRMRIHNAYIEESVDLINRQDKNFLFTMVVGDITDDWGYERDFKKMNDYLSKLKTPVLYEIGNHETRLKSSFSPGYNMDEFNNYFAAQKDINGLEKLLYSYDLGKWHFIVWPDPLRKNFWDNHPHYFDWLEKDLAEHKHMPVMIFQHVPVHPMGINPFLNYCETVEVKRTLFDIFSKYGNVKYVLSGHVHIPVKSSFKTAVSYKGINFINLPAAGYRPRAFGEQDYYGGPCQGSAFVDITGEKATIRYKTVTEEEYEYPEVLPEFDTKKYALWLSHKWELPAKNHIVNGEFINGLNGWVKRYVYQEDETPSNICEVKRNIRQNSYYSLYMLTRRRGYMAPGQDRLPQDVNRICQAVSLKPGKSPFVRFHYMIDGKNTDFSGYCGAYVWLEGFRGSVRLLNMMYSLHRIWYNIGGAQSGLRITKPIMLGLNNEPDTWHETVLNIEQDFNNYNEDEQKFSELQLNRLVLSFGLWNINDGREQPFAVCFDTVDLSYDLKSNSRAGNKDISLKPQEEIWWRGKHVPNKNIAGEHRYYLETK